MFVPGSGLIIEQDKGVLLFLCPGVTHPRRMPGIIAVALQRESAAGSGPQTDHRSARKARPFDRRKRSSWHTSSQRTGAKAGRAPHVGGRRGPTRARRDGGRNAPTRAREERAAGGKHRHQSTTSPRKGSQRHRNAKSRTKRNSRSTASRARADYSTKSSSHNTGRAARAPRERESSRSHGGEPTTGGRQSRLGFGGSGLTKFDGAQLEAYRASFRDVNSPVYRRLKSIAFMADLLERPRRGIAQPTGRQLANACRSQCAPDSGAPQPTGATHRAAAAQCGPGALAYRAARARSPAGRVHSSTGGTERAAPERRRTAQAGQRDAAAAARPGAAHSARARQAATDAERKAEGRGAGGRLFPSPRPLHGLSERFSTRA